MSTKVMTHKGNIVGNNNCAPDGFKRAVRLRETKTQWVDASGSKWSKSLRGLPAGTYRDRASSWPAYRLDLDSIKPLEVTSK